MCKEDKEIIETLDKVMVNELKLLLSKCEERILGWN